MNIKKYVFQGVPVTLIKTDKFKTISIQVHLFGIFNKEMATRRRLLTMLLDSTCEKYYTDELVANKSLDLYNTNCYVSTSAIYKTSDTVFSTTFISEKYLPKRNELTKDVITFLSEFIFKPKIINGVFDEKEFLEKKRDLKVKIESLYNNKSRYAIKRLFQNMAKDEILSVSTLGTIEDLEKITSKDLVNEYNQLLNEDAYIYICGDLDENKLEDYLSPLLKLKNNHHLYELEEKSIIKIEKVKEIIEKRPNNQAQLVLGYRLPYSFSDDGNIVLNVFNLMFGGLFTSSLFQEIREKNSLAYSIYSSIISDCKVMIVAAGIDEDNYELTVKLINEELKKYQNGEIDEELLKMAKDEINSEGENITDRASSMIDYAMRFDIYEKARKLEKIKEMVNAVTKEDIQNVSKEIFLDTIYLQKNGEE